MLLEAPQIPEQLIPYFHLSHLFLLTFHLPAFLLSSGHQYPAAGSSACSLQNMPQTPALQCPTLPVLPQPRWDSHGTAASELPPPALKTTPRSYSTDLPPLNTHLGYTAPSLLMAFSGALDTGSCKYWQEPELKPLCCIFISRTRRRISCTAALFHLQ